jgi:hypothetical protein
MQSSTGDQGPGGERGAAETRLGALLEELPSLVDADPDLVRRGAALDVVFQLGIGNVPYFVTIAGGRVEAVERGPLLMRSCRFSIRAAAEAWARFWAPLPAPGWHDLFALTKSGAARIEGDFHPLMANLQYVKDVLAAPRRAVGEKR